jgi:hypothetical protein
MSFGRWASHLLLLAGTGCADAGTTSAPPRSPSLDYPPPAAQTSNGQVVGADQVPPGDKLRQSPRIGPEGPIPSERPGGPENQGFGPTQEPRSVPGEPKRGAPSDPCAQMGLDEAARADCERRRAAPPPVQGAPR